MTDADYPLDTACTHNILDRTYGCIFCRDEEIQRLEAALEAEIKLAFHSGAEWGHDSTVESCYSDPETGAEDYWDERKKALGE